MTHPLLNAIAESFPLTELDCRTFACMEVNGFSCRIRRFAAEGLGNVSLMAATGPGGQMQMDVLIAAPTDRDMPLLSLDRVKAAGSDTLIVEMYDTLLGTPDLTAMDEAVQAAAPLRDKDPGVHWYDPIKLPQSLCKAGKAEECAAFDAASEKYLRQYAAAARGAGTCDAAAKRKKTAAYVEGLLSRGGPATDLFLTGIGARKTAELFTKVLFATEE